MMLRGDCTLNLVCWSQLAQKHSSNCCCYGNTIPRVLCNKKKPKMVPITEQVNNQHCTFKRGGGVYVLLRFLECNTCFFLHRSAVQAGMGDCTFFIYIYLYYELIWVTSVPFSTWNTVNNRRTQAEARVAELMLHQLRIMLLYYTGFPLSATGWNV